MDELHALERHEALRRAEYEARHAEALRRAEYEAHFGPLRSDWPHPNSATTSPLISPSGLSTRETGYFGSSSDRGSFNPQAPEVDIETYEPHHQRYLDREFVERRRLSGPAWLPNLIDHDVKPPASMRSASIQSKSSGHLVNTRSLSWADLQHDHYVAHRHPPNDMPLPGTEDSPSPMSSDSESLPIQMRKPSSAYKGLYYKQTHPALSGPQQAHRVSCSPPILSSGRASGFTPSTSPFLGPLRTLNIHSAHPSRVPSPVLLPPSHMMSQSEESMDSPTSAMQPPSSVSTASSFPSSSSRSSSTTSWEKPHHQRTNTSGLAFPPGDRLVPGSLTPSRPPSPQLSSPPTSQRLEPAVPHHHLAHSVRVAFEMTPIVSAPARSPGHAPRGFLPVSQPHSGVSTPMALSLPRSMPTSRSGSPPIKLPPLKKRDLALDYGVIGVVKERAKEKVELPGFSQFEAAVRAPSRS